MGRASKRRAEAKANGGAKSAKGTPKVGAFGQEIWPNTISLCMIAYNEERFIADCLRSVAGVVDEIIVAVDGRSDDGTAQIAAEIAPQAAEHGGVFPFTWADHFGEARDEALQHCHGEWVMFIDADERLRCPQGPEAARNHILTMPQRLPDASFAMLVAYNRDEHGAATDDGDLLRIARNHPRLTFKGRIHEGFYLPEDIRVSAIRLAPEMLHLDHYGYAPGVAAEKHKRERNIRLLRRMVAEEPEAYTALHYLAGELAAVGEIDEAMDLFERAWARAEKTKRARRSTLYFICALSVADCLRRSGRQVEAVHRCKQVLVQYPKWAALWMELGRALSGLGRWEEALAAFVTAREWAGERLFMVPYSPRVAPEAAVCVAVCLERLGRAAEALVRYREAAADPNAPDYALADAEAAIARLAVAPAGVMWSPEVSRGFVNAGGSGGSVLVNWPQ